MIGRDENEYLIDRLCKLLNLKPTNDFNSIENAISKLLEERDDYLELIKELCIIAEVKPPVSDNKIKDTDQLKQYILKSKSEINFLSSIKKTIGKLLRFNFDDKYDSRKLLENLKALDRRMDYLKNENAELLQDIKQYQKESSYRNNLLESKEKELELLKAYKIKYEELDEQNRKLMGDLHMKKVDRLEFQIIDNNKVNFQTIIKGYENLKSEYNSFVREIIEKVGINSKHFKAELHREISKLIFTETIMKENIDEKAFLDKLGEKINDKYFIDNFFIYNLTRLKADFKNLLTDSETIPNLDGSKSCIFFIAEKGSKFIPYEHETKGKYEDEIDTSEWSVEFTVFPGLKINDNNRLTVKSKANVHVVA